jgi:hypothetical protein
MFKNHIGMIPDQLPDEIVSKNYLDLKEILETGLENAGRAARLFEAKGILIEVQNHFRGLKLRREDREELYTRLQAAFAVVNKKIDDERLEFELTSLSNFEELTPGIEQASVMAETAEDTREAWNFLLNVQDQVRSAKLSREHRDALNLKLQDAFDLIKLRREEEQHKFGLASRQNYTRLKSMVEQGLAQAQESHEYKETREFLKKIQSEFKGLKMTREQHEELYTRLQTAFDILGERLDDFFRNKKKNWEVKMQFKLSSYAADIFELREVLEKEKENLEELEDQLGNMASSGRGEETRQALKARINSAKLEIENKMRQITELEIERDALKNKLEESQ